jgi:hypothetical protein
MNGKNHQSSDSNAEDSEFGNYKKDRNGPFPYSMRTGVKITKPFFFFVRDEMP